MSRWFRFYDDAINDPKILKLSDKLHRVWVGLLCIASKNDGQLPSLDDCALMIRMKAEKLEDAIKSLMIAGLIDEDGPIRSPHNWNARQFKSDVSTDRVKRFREQQRNVSVTPPETEQRQNRTDIPKPAAKPTVVRDPVFEELRKAYPRRKGGDPGPPAAKLFLAAIKAGTEPQIIIDGAKRFAVEESQNINTPYIPQLVKWLRDKRWLDHTGNGTAQPSFDIRSSLV